MGKHVAFIAIIVVIGAMVLSIGAAPVDPPQGPPPGWEAKPPFHVRGNASTSPVGYTPAQIRQAYGFDQLANDGAGQIIAIVDAFDDPSAAADLQTFINAFGLQTMNGLPGTATCTVGSGASTPCFQKVYAQGKKPRTDAGWALEISLDVQWAHAIAPKADILLVEAASNSFANLLGAVDVAANKAEVTSMSWGGSEFSSETSYDSHFKAAGVTFVASSGDSGNGGSYPAASPYVVSVGGTTLSLDKQGNIASETAWSGSGGGISAYEMQPGYQSSFASSGGKRAIPDVSYDADPGSGFAIYDSTSYHGQKGWFKVGGTSAGSPQWAALVALADQGRSSGLSSNNLTSSPEYAAAGASVYSSNYRDVSSGTNGTCGSTCTAASGYDFVTGLGSPAPLNLVPFLSAY